MANYTIEGKKIIAEIGKLTAKEVKAIQNYLSFGYTLEEKQKVEKPVNEKFTQENIQKYIETNGTKEQQAKYWELFNAEVKDDDGNIVLYKTDVYKKEKYTDKDGKERTRIYKDKDGNKVLLHKKGEKRVKGHIATLYWFKQTFKDYCEE